MGGVTSGKSDAKLKVVDYYAAMQNGYCYGPVDAISQILIGEKYVYPLADPYRTIAAVPVPDPLTGGTMLLAVNWEGLPKITASTQFLCNMPELFGGDDHEGGCVGQIGVYLGSDTQVISDFWAFRYGRNNVNSPGYRHMCCLFFGHAWALWPGFLWSTNSPLLREVWITVQRAPKTSLNPAKRDIPPVPIRRTRNAEIIDPETGDTTTVEVNDLFVAGPDTNGAHIILECLMDEDFGLGMEGADIDLQSFETASDTLFAENLGLSMQWTTQATIEDFIRDVEMHIEGKLFVSPVTGLLTLKLVREVTDLSGVFDIDPSNARMTSFQRKSLAETINEVVVTWTNPWNEEGETQVVINPASAVVRGVTQDSKNYYGARNPQLAQRLGARDLRSASAPLATAEMVVNREGWTLVPTDVVRLTWPEFGINGIIFRILKIDYGKPGDTMLKVSLVEDVFAHDIGQYDSPPNRSGGGDVIEAPQPMRFQRAINAPAFPLVTAGVLAGMDASEGYAAILSSQPSNYNLDAKLNEQIPKLNGDLVWETVTAIPVLGRSYIDALDAEAMSIITTLGPLTGGPAPNTSWIGVIGEVGDDEAEIVMVQKIDISPVRYWLVRGCMDTVPRAWPNHTPVYWLDISTAPIFNPRVQTVGSTAHFKLQTRVQGVTLPLADATEFTLAVIDRPQRPNRPAGVKINGLGMREDWQFVSSVPTIPGSPVTALPYQDGWPAYTLPNAGGMTVTWATRNRLLENGRLQAWTDGPVAPEAAQTTRLRFETAAGVLRHEIAGLTGNSYLIPQSVVDADLGGGWLFVYADRDGYESLQAAKIKIIDPHAAALDSDEITLDDITLTLDAN